jgi:hypothetical protein
MASPGPGEPDLAQSWHYILPSSGPTRNRLGAVARADGGWSRFLVGMRDAPQPHVTTVLEGQDDVHGLDPGRLLEHGPGARSKPSLPLPALQRLPHREGEEADQDVRLDPVLALMPDRTDLEVRLLAAESRLGLADARLLRSSSRPISRSTWLRSGGLVPLSSVSTALRGRR